MNITTSATALHSFVASVVYSTHSAVSHLHTQVSTSQGTTQSLPTVPTVSAIQSDVQGGPYLPSVISSVPAVPQMTSASDTQASSTAVVTTSVVSTQPATFVTQASDDHDNTPLDLILGKVDKTSNVPALSTAVTSKIDSVTRPTTETCAESTSVSAAQVYTSPTKPAQSVTTLAATTSSVQIVQTSHIPPKAESPMDTTHIQESAASVPMTISATPAIVQGGAAAVPQLSTPSHATGTDVTRKSNVRLSPQMTSRLLFALPKR